MRYRRPSRLARASLGFNATPLVDVIFTLTIFFMLVSTFSAVESVPMQLPSPTGSQAKLVKTPQRVVINCRLDDTGEYAGEIAYSIGPNRPESLVDIAERLAEMRQENPEMRVVIRADRRLRYDDVRAVMKAIAAEGVEIVSVAAETSGRER